MEIHSWKLTEKSERWKCEWITIYTKKWPMTWWFYCHQWTLINDNK